MLAEQLGELLLQLADVSGLAGDLALGVRKVCLQGCSAHHRAAAVRRGGIGLGGVDLAQQMVLRGSPSLRRTLQRSFRSSAAVDDEWQSQQVLS